MREDSAPGHKETVNEAQARAKLREIVVGLSAALPCAGPVMSKSIDGRLEAGNEIAKIEWKRIAIEAAVMLKDVTERL